MDWRDNPGVLEKLFAGEPLDSTDRRRFIKTKFHAAREVEVPTPNGQREFEVIKLITIHDE